MEIELTGRKVEVTPALKALTIEKLEKIKTACLAYNACTCDFQCRKPHPSSRRSQCALIRNGY